MTASRLQPGTRLGPYEILAPIGAGGMGEVYRARDTRLGREVAVKVLPSAFASDPDRQRRFEAEARAAGALNHPNIVTLFDVGSSDGAPYLVTEVLEGETLRALLSRGPLPPVRAAALLGQAAQGLAAAHAKGIVHRDLKPENLFVLRDGRVKVLDFGIAKLVRVDAFELAETTPVFASLTASGTILGTVSYMAPEQLRDQPVDHRADLFALGAILYEAVTGKVAFAADTAADRVTAILSSEPPALPPDIEAGLPGLSALIRRCLEKRPEVRFESARDLGYALEILAQASEWSGERGAGATAEGVGSSLVTTSIRQLTFREGRVTAARFAPDGVTIVYRASWDGEPYQIYLSRTDNLDYQPLHLPDAELLAVSSSAELAIGLQPRDVGGFVRLHTLARVSMLGGVPRELARDVYMADWGPGGRSIAAIREMGGRFRLEYPLGEVLHETPGWLSHVRVSPSGRRIAFFEHPIGGDNGGHLRVIEPGGRPKTVVAGMNTAVSLAWHPEEHEIWFVGVLEGQLSGMLHATSLDGAVRAVYQGLGWVDLQDFSTDGQVLIQRVKPRIRLQTGTRAGDRRDLSWLDWTAVRDISADGSSVLFDETGTGVLYGAAVYVRDVDGSPAVRIGEGAAMAFMPDQERVLVIEVADRRTLAIYPLGAGEPHRIPLGSLVCHDARPFPDGASIALLANTRGEPGRLYRLEIATGSLTLLSEEPIAFAHILVSPDGKYVNARRGDGTFALFPCDGGAPRPLSIEPDERIGQWSADGRSVFVFRRGSIPSPVVRVDLDSGRREPWYTVEPMVRHGTDSIISVVMTSDGEHYASSFIQNLTDLFVVVGLH